MKQDRYTEELKAIVSQAKTEWDIEKMRLAVIEARALVEAMAYKVRQDKFKIKVGGR